MIIFRKRLLMDCEGEDAGGGGGTGSEAAAGGSQSSWLEGMPEEISTNPSVVKFKTPADMAKSYIHLQRQMGRDKVALPGENATEEDWNSFFKAAGRPDDPTAYEIGAPEQLPKGYQYPKQLEDNFRKWAHKHGLSTKQAKGMWADITGHTVTSFKDHHGKVSAENQKSWDALKTDWGGNYNSRKELATKAFDAVNRSLGKENAMPRQLLDNPRFMRAFAHIGEMASEDSLAGVKGSPAGVMSVAEAKARKGELMADPAYMNKKDPRHKKVFEEVQQMFRIIHGSN